MANPNLIEIPEKIGIGTWPAFGVPRMFSDLNAISADWFYTWAPALRLDTLGWTLGSTAGPVSVGTNTALQLTGTDGWAYQGLAVASGQPWSLSFDAQSVSGSGGGVVVSWRDSAGAQIAQDYSWVPSAGPGFALSGTVPVNATNAYLIPAADPNGSLTLDNFSFKLSGTSQLTNGDFEAHYSASDLGKFVPMIWGAADMGSLAAVASANPGGTLLTFNEPDHYQQSNMSVNQALSYWPALMASGMRLGSPAVTTWSTLKTGGWLDSFMSQANSLGYRVDFIAVHYYTTNPDVRAFKSFLDQVYAKYGLPVWVTEWSLADWNNIGRFSKGEQQAFFNAGSQMLDDLPYVERQAWFSAYQASGLQGLHTDLFDASDTITSVGDSFTLLAQPVPVLTGGPGDDILPGVLDATRYVGGAGIDTVDFSAQVGGITGDLADTLRFQQIEALAGGAGPDQLFGDSNANILIGRGGNDRLDGRGGADVMVGGAGDDTYVVDDSRDVVDETDGAGGDMGGLDTVLTSVSYVLPGFVENLTLTGPAAIDGTGNGLANVLNGNAAANVLDGRDGNDTLNGNAGNDVLIGGLGDDILNGGLDDDRLLGGAGADRLTGGAGADVMAGGAGNDTYYVDNVGDVVDETDGNGGDAGGVDTLYSTISFALTGLAGYVENLVLSGTTAINGAGNDLNNLLIGNAAANLLDGGPGNDTLNGNAGDDVLIGGAGNDVLNGGAGDDRLFGGVGADRLDGGLGADFMAGGADNDSYVVDNIGDIVDETDGAGGDAGGIDVVTSSISFALTGLARFVENLTLSGTVAINGAGNDLNNVLTGNAAANVLDGGLGNDTLNGGLGNDILIGGAGDDRLTGGADVDTFAFALGSGKDTITDFAPGSGEIIQLAYGAAFDTFGEVMAGSRQSGANTIITLTANDTITLLNVTLGSLSAANFSFA
ncbi:MAG: glycosyl hydrolase [Novosphingobium sp.]